MTDDGEGRKASPTFLLRCGTPNVEERSSQQEELVGSSAEASALRAPIETALRVPCYCEENVWRLAYRRTRAQKHPGEHYVVFISNETQCVPMFYQLAKDNPHQPCLWDYHVVLLWTYESQITPGGSALGTNGITKRQRTVVLDMDSHLQYPCPLEEYLINTFPLDYDYTGDRLKFKPVFRVVEASQFLKWFCSDRLHMFDADTQEWSAPPPEYDCIQTNERLTSNLHQYIKMEQHIDGKTWADKSAAGDVLSLEQLRLRFGDSYSS